MNSITLNDSIDNYYLQTNQAPLERNYLTIVKTERVALYALSGALIGGSAALTTFSISGAISAPLALLTIPAVALAILMIRYARSLNDYADPVELDDMRKRAASMPLSQIVKKHGLDKIKQFEIVPLEVLQRKFLEENEHDYLSHILKDFSLKEITFYNLVPIETLQKSLVQELQGMTVSKFCHRFNLQNLHQYKVLSNAQFLTFNEIKQEMTALESTLSSGLRNLDELYPARQERLLAIEDRKADNAKVTAANAERDLRAARDLEKMRILRERPPHETSVYYENVLDDIYFPRLCSF